MGKVLLQGTKRCSIADCSHFSRTICAWIPNRCPDRALDTHIYQAWKDPDSRINYYQDACGQKGVIARMEAAFGPIIVGEWSLATDNCAMWLNGFNDNLPGFPRTGCKYIPCGESYLGSDQPGIPVDPSKAIQGPYGTGMSGPVFGLCPVGRDWPKESSGNPLTGRDWVRAPPDVPPQLDDTDHVMTNLARKKINAFSNIGHGFYFWNFRTDLYEPHWSYLQALDRGWIPNYNLNDPKIQTACDKEDIGEFKCVVKKGQLYSTVHDAVAYALNFQNRSDTPEAQAILNLTGTSFMDAANDVLGEFFDKFHTNGATCDFGGIGMLIELNRTTPDDDALLLTDDEYFGYVVVQNGTKLWKIVLLVVIGTLVGSCSGFIVAMHTNKAFNRRVRESVIFRPIKNTKSNLLRSSLALPAISDFQDIDGDHGGNGETTWLKK
jgi:glucan 1,3-beta-glucosidase